MVSKSVDCKPLRGVCTNNRKYKGQPSTRSSACGICGEYRCRQHCRCGRENKQFEGRQQPRNEAAVLQRRLGATPQQQTTQPSSSPEAVPSFSPAGAPSPQTWVELTSSEWWTQLLSRVQVAHEVELSALMCNCSCWLFVGATHEEAPTKTKLFALKKTKKLKARGSKGTKAPGTARVKNQTREKTHPKSSACPSARCVEHLSRS